MKYVHGLIMQVYAKFFTALRAQARVYKNLHALTQYTWPPLVHLTWQHPYWKRWFDDDDGLVDNSFLPMQLNGYSNTSPNSYGTIKWGRQ